MFSVALKASLGFSGVGLKKESELFEASQLSSVRGSVKWMPRFVQPRKLSARRPSAVLEHRRTHTQGRNKPPSSEPIFLHTKAEASEVRDKNEHGTKKGPGTVKEVFGAATRAIENVSVETVGKAAIYAGVAAFGTVMASNVVGTIDALPLVPGFMQVAGIAYCSTVAVRFLKGGQGRKLQLAPASPVRAVLDLVDSSTDRFGKADAEVPAGLEDPKVKNVMQQLVDQRNAAVKQARDIRAASTDLSRLLGEKEALETVALQLAQERDSAMSELTMLKNSVEAMTERMRGIDEMLALEVRRLQEQNNALESVAFALATERDHAIKEVEELKVTVDTNEEEKRALEILAAELIEERDDAWKEVEQYKKIVASLSEATGSTSGLTSQQETFLKNRVRAVRPQFVDIAKPYEQQSDNVGLLVAYMEDEYGAPADWTLTYMKQFLKSSSSGHSTGAVKAVEKSEKSTGSFHF